MGKSLDINEQKNPDPKEDALYDSTDIKYTKRKKCSIRTRIRTFVSSG